MTVQEFEALGKKVSEGNATAEEKLSFLRELNVSIDQLAARLSEENRAV